MLQKFKDNLIAGAGKWWKMNSIRLHVFATGILFLILDSPEGLTQVLDMFPAAIRAYVPAGLTATWLVIFPLVRLWRQSTIATPTDKTGA